VGKVYFIKKGKKCCPLSRFLFKDYVPVLVQHQSSSLRASLRASLDLVFDDSLKINGA
jgi:hypothetical protein